MSEFLKYIPVPLSLILSILANVGSGVINRHYTKTVSDSSGGIYFFLVITSFVSALFIGAVCGFNDTVSVYTAVTAVILGVVMALSAVLVLYSIAIGPWSYTTVITSFSMLIPTLIGAFLWNERIDVLTIIGIVLVAASIVLSVRKKKKQPNGDEQSNIDDRSQTRLSVKWFVAVIIAALATGAIGLIQKVHIKSAHSAEFMPMLAIAFAIMGGVCVVLLAVYMLRHKGQSIFTYPSENKKIRALRISAIVMAGLCGMIKNVFNTYLSGVMDSAVFFPLSNGGNLVLVTLLAIFIYKEKLSVTQWIGLGLGIVAVILLCL